MLTSLTPSSHKVFVYTQTEFSLLRDVNNIDVNNIMLLKKVLKKMIFKGSWTGLKFQYFIERYLGSRTRQRLKNWSVGVIFDA